MQRIPDPLQYLVVAGLVEPSPLQTQPASRPRTLRVLVLVELEAILGRP